VSPRVSLDVVASRKTPVIQPIAKSLYRLCYRGSDLKLIHLQIIVTLGS